MAVYGNACVGIAYYYVLLCSIELTLLQNKWITRGVRTVRCDPFILQRRKYIRDRNKRIFYPETCKSLLQVSASTPPTDLALIVLGLLVRPRVLVRKKETKVPTLYF